MHYEKIWKHWMAGHPFSGVFSVRNEEGIVFEACTGFRNRSESLPNQGDTAFGIASGTKLFTALAVCILVDQGRLSLDQRIWDVLPYNLGNIDRRVTLTQLLTHTSGIGDYLDEEASDAQEKEQELCNKYPVYLWERLDYYLQMITPLPPKFEPGARFGYSNAGFILLGLAVEAASGKSYQQFVTDALITPLGLKHTGFFRMDSLPANTALGYLGESTEGLRTNIFHLPVIGGADGGLFTCARDMDGLWRALFGGQILSDKMLQQFKKPHQTIGKGRSYGLGVYRSAALEHPAFVVVGGDFGVIFTSAYLTNRKVTATVLGNMEADTGPLLDALLSIHE